MSAVLGLRPADITWYCTPARILLLSWSTWCFLLPSCPLPSLSPSSVPPLFPTLCTPPCSALPCLPSIPPLPLLSLPLPCHLYSPPSPSLSSLSRLKKNWTSPLTQRFCFSICLSALHRITTVNLRKRFYGELEDTRPHTGRSWRSSGGPSRQVWPWGEFFCCQLRNSGWPEDILKCLGPGQLNWVKLFTQGFQCISMGHYIKPQCLDNKWLFPQTFKNVTTS